MKRKIEREKVQMKPPKVVHTYKFANVEPEPISNLALYVFISVSTNDMKQQKIGALNSSWHFKGGGMYLIFSS